MTPTRERGARLACAVVLARGQGSRLRRSADGATLTPAQRRAVEAGLKPLVPIRGRPLIEHALAGLRHAGFARAIVVVGPVHAASAAWFPPGATVADLDVDVVIQAEALGTADAVRSARDAIGDEDFAVVNGDNLYPSSGLRDLRAVEGPALLGFDRAALVEHGGIPADRVNAFALLTTDERDRLVEIIEKPDAEHAARLGPRASVSMNCWRFDARIFDAIDRLVPSPRGELELPDAVMRSIVEDGVQYTVVRSSDGVLDLTRADDVAALEARLAARERSADDG